MLITNKTMAGAGLVFVFGLMSCGPKNPPHRDSFRAPPPKIIKAEGAQDLKAWDQAEKKALDLQDAIDVTEAHAASVDVTARCRTNDREYFRVSRHSPATPIQFLQVLPLELLTMDISATPPSCAFELSLRNSLGSRHIFNLGSAIIHDSPNAESPLVLSRDSSGVTRAESYWRIQNLVNLKFRKRAGHLNRDITVICESGRTRPLAIDSVINVGDFDFEKMQLNPGQEANAFQRQPVQFCRGVILRGENAEAITPLFELHFPDQPLQMAVTAQRFRDVPGSFGEFLAASMGTPLPLDEYQISNPGANRRTLEIPKTPLSVQAIATPAPQTNLAIGAVVRPWLQVALRPSPDAAISEREDHWRVELKPGGTIHLTTAFQAGGAIRCNMAGIAIEFIQPLEVIERSERGREISRTQLNFGPRALVVHQADVKTLRTVTNPPNGICGW